MTINAYLFWTLADFTFIITCNYRLFISAYKPLIQGNRASKSFITYHDFHFDLSRLTFSNIPRITEFFCKACFSAFVNIPGRIFVIIDNFIGSVAAFLADEAIFYNGPVNSDQY